MQSWDIIKAFLALHRAGTFEGAAQSLNIDASTVRLGNVHFGLYAARGPTGEINPSAGQNLLALYAHHPRVDHDFLLADERWQADFRDGTIVARADGYPTLLRLCEEGMGVAMLPCMLGSASQRLHRLPSLRRTMEVGVWAVIRRDVRHLPKVRAMLAFLTKRFQRLAPVLAGMPHQVPDLA